VSRGSSDCLYLENNLDQHPLPASPVELPVKDPLPGAKDFGELSEAVETAVRHRNHYLQAHDAQLCELRSASVARRQPVPASGTGVFTSAVVQPACGPPASGPAMAGGRVRRWVQSSAHLLQPLFVIRVQAAFVVVDEDAGRNVRQYSTLHGIYKDQCPPCGIPNSYP
jgi:hypothetical protein